MSTVCPHTHYQQCHIGEHRLSTADQVNYSSLQHNNHNYPHVSIAMVCTFKNEACLRKSFRYCSALPLQMQLGRHKCSSRRSVSKAAPHFGNLCVYEPSALRKKPSASSEETFQLSEEAFRFAQMHFGKKCSECGIIFFDTYHSTHTEAYCSLPDNRDYLFTCSSSLIGQPYFSSGQNKREKYVWML